MKSILHTSIWILIYGLIAVVVYLFVRYCTDYDPKLEKFCKIYPNNDDKIYIDYCFSDSRLPMPLVIVMTIVISLFIWSFLCVVYYEYMIEHPLKRCSIPITAIIVVYLLSLVVGILFESDINYNTGYSNSKNSYCQEMSIILENFKNYTSSCKKAYCYLDNNTNQWIHCPLLGFSIIFIIIALIVACFMVKDAIKKCPHKNKVENNDEEEDEIYNV